ncbi:TPA: hypothetical protein ACHHA7_002767 [Staphylococcus aureus]|nr:MULTISPECIES: hypothetical protein [Staphylococcus]EGQ3127496.1 hypothetical protein [Staphylococcus pseudintermedius]MCC9107955.1 hypothetical protein [Staphylococcus aureus]MCE4962617.1 hypothetical protein [Staphylococcus chromogenes]MCE6047481.1 hypothetical protein [Staphylococcus aureus]MDG6600748.1 hypothetical protein [Staphylococcus aureus]
MVGNSNMSEEAKCIKETIEATLSFEDEPVEKIAKQHVFLNHASNTAIEEVIRSLSRNNVYGQVLKQFMEEGELKKVNYDIVKIDIVKAIESDKET